jgi:uncharacterized protein YkuJ
MLLALIALSLCLMPAVFHDTSNAQTLADNPLCPAEIPFGTLFDCSLSAVGEVDSYTFIGAANDSLSFRIYRTSGTFSARLIIKDPGANTVCEIVAFRAAPLIELACGLTVSGTYTVTIDDGLGTASGNYQVYAQRLNGAGNAKQIDYGSITEGSLSSVIEGHTYSFTAEQNDKLVVRFVRTVGAMTGRLRVFDSAGNEICQVVSFRAYFIVTIEPCIIEQGGKYNLIVDDAFGTALGDYRLHFQRYRAAGATADVSYGQIVSDELTNPAELDAFTTSVEANDLLHIRLVREVGAFTPQVRLFDKDGDLVCEVSAFRDAPVIVIEACAISKSGTHTFFVDDALLEQTGTYRLLVQRLNGAGTTLPLRFGQRQMGQIETIASFDTFTINIESAQSFTLAMSRTAGSYTPRIQVFDPAGTGICSAAAFRDAPTAEIAECAVTTSGTYTVIVDDQSLSGVGDYTLTLSCVSGSCQQKLFLPLVQR